MQISMPITENTGDVSQKTKNRSTTSFLSMCLKEMKSVYEILTYSDLLQANQKSQDLKST